MDDSRQRVVQFLEKEIKTYGALALSLAKKGIKEHARVEDERVSIPPILGGLAVAGGIALLLVEARRVP
jgi:hypothetical protein